MEDSLKRLKKGKGVGGSGTVGMSDDDKIRLQLYLDVSHLRQQVSGNQMCIAIGLNI